MQDETQHMYNDRLVAAPGPSGTDFAAVLGYRIMHKLECGRFMYIDDLITGPAARKMVKRVCGVVVVGVLSMYQYTVLPLSIVHTSSACMPVCFTGPGSAVG